MKNIFLYSLLFSGLIISCSKVSREDRFPDLVDKSTLDSTALSIQWLEQVARQKGDSIRISDSMRNVMGAGVDTKSLLNMKNIFVAYVEVNNRSLKNVTCFVDDKGTPLVDLAIIFAPNININPATGKAYIKYNDQVTALINAGYIRYVKSKGIKVGIDILGNHDAAGFQAFTTPELAKDFARIVASEMRRLDLDAVSFDDEYSNYQATSTESFVMVVDEIKKLLPDKLVMCDIYGGASFSKYNNKIMGDVADVAVPITYPSSFSPGYLNFPKERQLISEKADGSIYSDATFKSYMDAGYKGVMVFDFKTFQFNYWPYFQSRMRILKGTNLIEIPGCVDSREFDGINNTIQ